MPKKIDRRKTVKYNKKPVGVFASIANKIINEKE